jgi:mRNA interferase RelE/StbE
MRKIDLSKDAIKFLTRAHPKHAKQIAKKLNNLRENSHPHDAEQLKGCSYFRVDIGEYRVIYDVDNETVSVLLIGKRNDGEVYRKLRRKP